MYRTDGRNAAVMRSVRFMLSSRASRDNGDVVRETDFDRRRRRTAAARACTGIRAFLVDQPRGRHADAIRSLRPAGLAR